MWIIWYVRQKLFPPRNEIIKSRYAALFCYIWPWTQTHTLNNDWLTGWLTIRTIRKNNEAHTLWSQFSLSTSLVLYEYSLYSRLDRNIKWIVHDCTTPTLRILSNCGCNQGIKRGMTKQITFKFKTKLNFTQSRMLN